jgi:hypothetical protein
VGTNAKTIGYLTIGHTTDPFSLWEREKIKEEAVMDHKAIVTTRLAAVGITLSDEELTQLASAYANLLKWETVVQNMLEADTEPALIFQAKVED